MSTRAESTRGPFATALAPWLVAAATETRAQERSGGERLSARRRPGARLLFPSIAFALALMPAICQASGLEVLIDGRPPGPRSEPLIAGSPPATFTVDADAATRIAVTRISRGHQFKRVVVSRPVAREYRRARDGALAPVWVVDVATVDPWGIWRVFVNGRVPLVVRLLDLALDAKGRVFPDVRAVSRQRTVMRRLPELGAGGQLLGATVEVGDVEDFLALCPTTDLFCAPPRVLTCSAVAHGGKFDFPVHETGTFGTCASFDRFDQVTGYYHLARMAEYFRNSIGWQPGSGVLAGYLPLPVLTNIPAFINAFFAPPSEQWPAFLGFGDEFDPPAVVDFMRDPTVARHEFTHAMVYDLGSPLNDYFDCVDGCSPYVGALHEALADYFAVASLGHGTTVVGGQLGDRLVGAARNLVNDFRFPCDLTGEVHDDGRIWGGFLLEVRRLFGRSADRAIFHSLLALPHSPATLQFGDAVAALVATLPPLDQRRSIALAERAARRGLAGPNGYDRRDDVPVDSADTSWSCAPDATCTVDKVDRQEGSGAASIATGEEFGTGLAAYAPVDPPADLRGKPFLRATVKDALGTAAGALQILLDDTPDCSSPLHRLDVPALAPATWTPVLLPLGDSLDLSAIACVGLAITVDGGPRTVELDDIDGAASVRFGPVVLAVQASHELTFRNRFPAPLGDAHFYYFRPPAGATRVSLMARAVHGSPVNPDLHYCGTVAVQGAGTVPPELNAADLWAYDPSQTVVPFALTPLPLDQHLLVTGVPRSGKGKRVLRRFPLPASPSGIYAVSIQGSGQYRLKLVFE